MRSNQAALILLALIPSLLMAGLSPEKAPLTNYPLQTGTEGSPQLMGIAPPSMPFIMVSRDLIGTTEVIGRTWYKNQHNGTIGRMIEKSDDGYLHFVWMNGLDLGSINRHVYYNFIDPTGAQGWPGTGYPVEASYKAGYATLDVDYSGLAFPAFHWTNMPSGEFSTATAVDYFPHTGTFITFETPQVPGVPEVIWPKMQFDRNQVMHTLSTENPETGVAGDPQRHYYYRAEFDPLLYVTTYDPAELMTWTMTICGDVGTSEVSDKIAFAWSYPLDPNFPDPQYSYSQWDNDLFLLIDEDGVDPNWSGAVNITSFFPPNLSLLPDTLLANMDTLRVYTDCNVFIDQDDVVHVAITTPSYFSIQGYRYWHASMIWHWSEAIPEWRLIHNAFDDWWWNRVDCNAWNVKAQRPSLAQDPNTGYLYCTYQVFDCDTNALSLYEQPSGEVYVSVSTDGGQTWSLGINVTQTVTPDGGGPGDCWAEMCPSIAKLVDGTCYITYVLDRDAAWNVLPPPPYATLGEATYHNIPVDLIPTTPSVQQNVALSVGGAPPGPHINVNSMGKTVFPASGDALMFNIVCWDHNTGPETVDVWVTVTLPNGTTIGPLVGPVLNVTYDWSAIGNLQLFVPGRAPEGNYVLNGYIGNYPSITAENHMRFYKNSVDESGSDGWAIIFEGQEIELSENFRSTEILMIDEALTQEFDLVRIHPNPFNARTAISYQLSAVSHVHLAVYDITGRVAAELVNGWHDAGNYEVSFNGTDLASGVYLLRIEAEDFNKTQKLVLMK